MISKYKVEVKSPDLTDEQEAFLRSKLPHEYEWILLPDEGTRWPKVIDIFGTSSERHPNQEQGNADFDAIHSDLAQAWTDTKREYGLSDLPL